jgi:hypothetical protein
LQPLLEAHVSTANGTVLASLVAGRISVPPALHLQLTLDQQQVVGDIENALLHHRLTRAFCRASAAPALSPCFSRAWAMVFHSWPAGLGGRWRRSARDGQLLGLRRITLRQAHLGQAEQHLRLARCDALGTLQARSGTVEVTTALLLLGGGQQRQHRAVQLLVGRQATALARDAGRRLVRRRVLIEAMSNGSSAPGWGCGWGRC